MDLTVSEAAELLNVSVDTIRRWEKKGLIQASRSIHNYRLFNIDQLKEIQQRDGASLNRSYKVLRNQPTDYSVIELFAGAGGLALGLSNAGIQTKALFEIDKQAVETLKVNRPDWNIIQQDVRDVSFETYKGSIDIVAGGFPCQAFSYAGLGMGFTDTRGTLFFEFARCINEVQPKIVLGENVRGLVKHDNGRTLKTMINTLEELGYRVQYKIMRSQFLDVAQKRERLIIIGIRNDCTFDHIFPKEKNYTIPLIKALENCPNSAGYTYSERKKYIMDQIPPGGYWRDLPLELQKEYMGRSFYLGGGKTGMARRLSWDEPSLTLTCNPAQKQTERCHPTETRPLSCREYARIQSFPDDWVFTGSVAAQYRQIGNAVPVNLAYHVGCCLIAMLDGTFDSETMIKIEYQIPDFYQLHISTF